MASIARPPCDEGAILAGSCEHPAATNGRWILAATILGSSMAFIDGTVVNVALPALQSALHATLADVQWVVESYALFLAALLLIGGSLGDMYGRRKIFAAGVVLFSVASAWCGLAPNIRQLIVARGIQGIGGALLVPGSLALISANFSEKERGRAIGTWSGFTSITAAIGPVLGGWFTEHGSWRWVFFINLPLGLAVLLLTLWKVPESRAGNQGQRFDWPGGLLAVARLRRNRLCSDRIDAGRGCSRGHRSDCAVVLGSARVVADGSAPFVPFPQFQRSEPAHPFSLLRVERHALLFPAGSDTGAGLFGDGSGSRSAAFHSVDVPAVALVWRTSRSIWRQGSAGDRPPDRRRRIRAVCAGRVSAVPTGPRSSPRCWCWDSAWRSASPR